MQVHPGSRLYGRLSQLLRPLSRPVFRLLLPLAIVSAACAGCGSDQPVFTVNGEAVEKGEFELYTQKLRSGVIQHYTEQYGASFGKNYWTEKHGAPESPLEYIKKEALKQLVEAKLIQKQAQELKLEESFDYASFPEKLESENERRQKALENNQPVYGPTQYSEADYYDYLTANLKLGLVRKLLADPVWSPDEAELKAYYEANKDAMFHRPNSYSIKRIVIDKGDEPEAALKQAELLAQDIFGGKPFDVAAKQVHESGKPESEIWDPRKNMNPGMNDEGLLRMLQDMKAGDISGVWEETGSYQIIQLAEIMEGGYQPLEEVGGAIATMMVEKAFDAEVAEQADKAKVELTGAFNDFEME
nr:peptidylprolyl isomerase [Paenibacillus pasadenensis]